MNTTSSNLTEDPSKRDAVAPLRRPRVLVVREPSSRAVELADAIAALGYATEAASLGTWLEPAGRRTTADILVVDEGAPPADGLSICDRVRDAARDRGYVYTLVLSGANEPSRAALLRAGADAVLPPQPSVNDLQAALHVASRITSAQRSLVRDNRQLRRDSERARAAAAIDPLTGVFNRRQLEEDLAVSVQDSERAAIIMIDVDSFKHYNDSCGHLEGDRVLREIGAVCRTLSRRQDAVYRYGGEEFCILLRDTDAESARAVSERLVASVRHLIVPNPAWAQGCVTVSAGVAMGPASSVTAWIQRADRALYAAKDAGKNRVAVAS